MTKQTMDFPHLNMKKRKFEFPSFIITGDPSLAEVVPEKIENRRKFAECATMLELQHMLSRRSDLAGAVMVQRLIESHEQEVLKAIGGLQEGLGEGFKEVREAISSLPGLTEVAKKVEETLRRLKDEGIVDSESLATQLRKELNDVYGLNDLCGTLKKAYGGDGRVSKAIQNIEELLNDIDEIQKAIKEQPTDDKIATAVANREKERFDEIKKQLNELGDTLKEIRGERIRKREKIRAIIETGEQEFEKEAGAFLLEEFNPRYKIIDVRNKEGAISRKTGDHILERNGAHNYKIVIDWKKTNPEKPRIITLQDAIQIAEDAKQNRKADASIICTHLAEQLPPEANGLYLFDNRTVLTHFGLLKLAVVLLETLIEVEEQKQVERDMDIQYVEEIIIRLKQGNSDLETTVRSLKMAESCLRQSIGRLIDYQQQVAQRAIKELRIAIKTNG